jgi:hypothetical protein
MSGEGCIVRGAAVSIVLLLLGLFQATAWGEGPVTRRSGIPAERVGEPRVRERTDREKPLPETESVTVKGKVEDLYGKIYFSDAIKLKNEHFVVGKDPLLAEIDLMERSLDRVEKGEVPAEEMHMVVTRYHLADERVFKQLERAVKLGIRADVITDLNDSVTVDFKKGEKSISDFTDPRVKPDNSPNGRFYAKLLKLGFEHNEQGKKKRPQFGLYSQPVFNKAGDRAEGEEEGKITIYDIMHEKGITVARVKGGKVVEAEATSGSANMVAHGASAKLTKNKDIVTRVNTVRQIESTELARRRYEHALNLRETFAQGGAINDTPEEKFIRVNTDNGFVETGFTNGKHNLNDRIAALTLHAAPGVTPELVAKGFDQGVESYYKRAAKEFKGWKIDEIREMEFVNTHTQTRIAEQVLFEQDGDIKKLGLYDAKFNEVRGWGFPPIQVGVDLLRPMGGTLFGLKRALSERMDSQVYLRGIPGIKETDLDGAPFARHLLHTKLYMLRGKLADGTPVTVIFDGSLNKSNHKENAEDQDMIVVYGKSEFADSYWSLPEKLMEATPEHFAPAQVQLMRDVFARFTGHSPLEVSQEFAENMSRLIALGKVSEATKELYELAKVKTNLKRKPSAAKVKERIVAFSRFLEWHKETFPNLYGKEENFYLRKLLDVAALLTHEDIATNQAAYELKGVLWSPNTEESVILERAKHAWELLGKKDAFPEFKPKEEAEEGARAATVHDIETARDKKEGKAAGAPADCNDAKRRVSGRRRT